METLSRKIYPLVGVKATLNRMTLEMIPFSANKKQPLNRKVVSNDNLASFHYVAPTPITDYESKTFFSLIKACLDADAYKGEAAIKVVERYGNRADFITVEVDLYDMANFISGKRQYKEARRIYESLKKVAAMQIDIITTAAHGVVASRFTTSWLHNLSTMNDHKTVILDVHRGALIACLTDDMRAKIGLKRRNNKHYGGIGLNLKHSMQYRGNEYLFYMFLQTQKDAKGWYHIHIKHDRIVAALGMGGYELKRQKRDIKKLFAGVGLRYEFIAAHGDIKDNWRRMKK